MYRVLAPQPPESIDGNIDLDFRRPESWRRTGDGHGLGVMLGDDEAGPFVYLSSYPPQDEMMPTAFAHAHASDNWRITVRGTTNMGKDAYTDGQFRFQDGGVPYASDNFAWGPDGGFGLIMFADRRGFAINPVKKQIAEKVVPEQEAVGTALGIDMRDPCPGAPAIATTLGGTDRGHLIAGFESAAGWPELVPGVRATASLLGEPECGPVVLLLDCDVGAAALPTRTIATEMLVAPLTGSVAAGDDVLEQGDVRIIESGVAAPAMVAGTGGARLTAIVADRRALVDALADGDVAGEWGAGMSRLLDGLRSALTAAT